MPALPPKADIPQGCPLYRRKRTFRRVRNVSA